MKYIIERKVQKMNEVIQNMLTRKSIRTYKEEQVSDDQLNIVMRLQNMHQVEVINKLGNLQWCKIKKN